MLDRGPRHYPLREFGVAESAPVEPFLVPSNQTAVIQECATRKAPPGQGPMMMSILVERSDFDPNTGYQYYVAFNPNGSFEEDEVQSRVPVEVALSLSENCELADFSLDLPKTLRTREALDFIRPNNNARFVEPRLYVTFPNLNGDTVTLAAGRLELDLTGRIIGLEILWAPSDENGNGVS